MSRTSLRLLTGLCTCLFLSCGELPSSDGVPDDPRVILPLQVYPNQTFILDASGSTAYQREIRGYIFSTGDSNPDLVSRSSKLTYAYNALGTFQVSVSLLDGTGTAETSIEVVSCDTASLACIPERPCPPGYTCENGSCQPAFIACEAHSDCPLGLSCLKGACGVGGPCEDPVDPPPGGEDCEIHANCSDDAFCVDEVCQVATCNGICESQVVASYSLEVTSATGIAINRPELRRDPASLFYTQDESGLIHAYTFEQLEPGTSGLPDEPPRYKGVLVSQGLFESQFSVEQPRQQWIGLDLVNGEELGQPGVSFLLSTGHNSGFANVPLAEGSDPLAFASLVILEEGLAWVDDLANSELPVLANGLDDTFAGYNIETHEILVSADNLELDRVVGEYEPLTGALICGVARDEGAVYLLENRISADGTGLTAARIVKLDPDADPQYFAVPVRAACGLERGLEPGQLFYTSWQPTETSWLVEQQLP